ncbi:MAG: flagellar filament capping protein FliD, partial [Comamonas sp.]
MAISSVGIGSGLDVESIVTQLVALEKQPIKTLEAKASVISSKISTYGEIKSLVDDLNGAVRDLTLDSGFGAVKINSSNTAAVTATMTGLASQGSYNIAVQDLAQSQTSASLKLAANATLGTNGTMTFVLGNANNSTTTLQTVALDVSSTDQLSDVVTKINSDTVLSKSVIASVITDSAGQQQLMIRSRETGLDNQFSVSLAARDLSEAEQATFDADTAKWNQWTAWSTWNSLSAAEKLTHTEPSTDLIQSSPDAPPTEPEVSSLIKLSGATGLIKTQDA